MTAVLILVAVCVGLIAGWLVNVAVDRVPRGSSLARLRTLCSRCDSERPPQESLPVASWVRRPCPRCGRRTPARYAITELLTSLAWALLAWWAATDTERLAMLPVLLAVCTACIALWQIDVAHHRLPNAIVYPLYPIVGLGMVVACLVTGSLPLASIVGSMVLWTVVFAGLHLVTRGRGMGMGDVKLAPILAAVLGWFGWGASVLALVATFIIGGTTGAMLLVSRRRTREQAVAFGPFMIIGLAAGVLLGSAAAQWYISAG